MAFHSCRKFYHFMMDLLEKVMHFIEEENYSALEAIYNAELAKLRQMCCNFEQRPVGGRLVS